MGAEEECTFFISDGGFDGIGLSSSSSHEDASCCEHLFWVLHLVDIVDTEDGLFGISGDEVGSLVVVDVVGGVDLSSGGMGNDGGFDGRSDDVSFSDSRLSAKIDDNRAGARANLVAFPGSSSEDISVGLVLEDGIHSSAELGQSTIALDLGVESNAEAMFSEHG